MKIGYNNYEYILKTFWKKWGKSVNYNIRKLGYEKSQNSETRRWFMCVAYSLGNFDRPYWSLQAVVASLIYFWSELYHVNGIWYRQIYHKQSLKEWKKLEVQNIIKTSPEKIQNSQIWLCLRVRKSSRYSVQFSHGSVNCIVNKHFTVK
jgi:hypothetical protein